jgi:protoheme IX farnesyltransferase
VATLNQYIERDIDRLMERTAGRPLPTGRLLNTEALVFGILQCAVAEVYLYFLVNPLTAALGLVVIVRLRFSIYAAKNAHVSFYRHRGDSRSDAAAYGLDRGIKRHHSRSMVSFVILFLWQFPHFPGYCIDVPGRICEGGHQDASCA